MGSEGGTAYRNNPPCHRCGRVAYFIMPAPMEALTQWVCWDYPACEPKRPPRLSASERRRRRPLRWWERFVNTEPREGGERHG